MGVSGRYDYDCSTYNQTRLGSRNHRHVHFSRIRTRRLCNRYQSSDDTCGGTTIHTRHMDLSSIPW